MSLWESLTVSNANVHGDSPDATPHFGRLILNESWAAIVVTCVAIPMGMGIALISGAPPMAGIISGAIGGLVVGWLSGSPTSITGPSAGLTLVIGGQLVALGGFETFLLAVVVAGVLQVLFGILKLGWLSSFFPSSVIESLLAAMGILLILKNIPHLLGHDTDPLGDMAFFQPDRKTTLSELLTLVSGEVHRGAMLVGLTTLAVLLGLRAVTKERWLPVPSMLVAILFGVFLSLMVRFLGGEWVIDGKHLIQLPTWSDETPRSSMFAFPNWSQFANPAVYLTAGLIALVSSLESLLNLSATDRLDRSDRPSPASRELVALGLGNALAGLIGGIPMSATIERSAVSLQSGSLTKLCGVFQGGILLVAAMALPATFNLVPLSVLAAILIMTGLWLARPMAFIQIWKDGRYQWWPFVVTLVAILTTDLLVGVVVGLCFAVGFILNSNLRRPLRRVMERHVAGEILHIELANQVSFLNRPVIERALRDAPPGTHILLDARNSDYIDPDILSMIRTFANKASVHGVTVSLRGFRDKYAMDDVIQFVDFTSREIQEKLTPAEVLKILKEGNERFCQDRRLSRDLGRLIKATSAGQHPFAAVLSCIDSRAPVETILDLGVGDVFSARVAGNVTSPKMLGSLEYATAVAGAKLILVLGHTKCGAVHSAVKLADAGKTGYEATGCQHLDSVLQEIHPSIDLTAYQQIEPSAEDQRNGFIEDVARLNVVRSVQQIVGTSQTIQKLVDEAKLGVVGAIYDVHSGRIEFLVDQAVGLNSPSHC